MVHFEFDSKLQVLNCRMTDAICLDDIIDFIETIIRVDDLPFNLKMVINMLNARVDFDIEDFQKIIDANNKLFEKYESVRHAIIINSPKDTAFALYYKEINIKDNYFFKVFSTTKAAQEWIAYV